MGSILYFTGKAICCLILRAIFQTNVQGRERIPLTGPVIVVSNHISFVDPPLIAVVIPRPVEFMTMIELFRRPVLAKLARAVGCIPVDRAKVDSTAVRETIRRLRAGHCIGIFPEAGIRDGPDSVLGGNPSLRPGLESIALLGRAAVLPVIVRDTRKPYQWRNWLRRESLRITIGYPFCLWQPAIRSDRQHVRDVVRTELLKTVALN